jgi:hypothetical protein
MSLNSNAVVWRLDVDEQGIGVGHPQRGMIVGRRIHGRGFWGKKTVERSGFSTEPALAKPRPVFIHSGWRQAPRALRIC